MNNIRHAIFPGILAGILSIFLISTTIRKPDIVLAASANMTANSEIQNNDMACSLSSNYPSSILQWCEWIESSARETGLEPGLIAAVMLQESGGNPEAYSSSGAVGLMQIMPRDGLAEGFMCANGPCFASRPSMQELFEPQYNISYGSHMLAGLVNKYGDTREALRAYGPMDVGYYYADIVLEIYASY